MGDGTRQINDTVHPLSLIFLNFSNETTAKILSQDEFPTNAVPEHRVAGLTEIVIFTVIFFIIGAVGIVGNFLVIYAIVCDRKMRSSVTNLLITNLALADLIIMIFGIPEIIQFMLNRGWILESLLCKANRFILVVSLYASVMTLVSICIERYIGIVHPIKAHILCSRARVAVVVACIWPLSLAAGTPTLLFNEMEEGSRGTKVKLCHIRFPRKPFDYFLVFKYIEFVIFYVVPLIIQITLYAKVSTQLFNASDKLRRERASDALLARKGVVKMLMMSVVVYFLSYSPQHVLLVYRSFKHNDFHDMWTLNVLVSVIAYMNSAANPILYSIFSQNFRTNFRNVLCLVHRQLPTPDPRRQSTLSTSTKFARMTSLVPSANSEL
ncbi:neuropeptide receptor 15-like [Physella acuta]|uniref:neuropeptide receptor 15-like n=1 Tax=Physella acuta TaxID=109671 RepID=UPI0027DC80A9|nr:neuropeptide receptor 15-like [Physella acuta]